MNINIFSKIEENAINGNYIDNIAITQIISLKKTETISYKGLLELSKKASIALLELGIKRNNKMESSNFY